MLEYNCSQNNILLQIKSNLTASEIDALDTFVLA